MNMNSGKTIAQITSEDYRTAVIFKKFGIDFCCGGKKTIQEACTDKNIQVEELISALNQSTQNLVTEPNYDEWGLDFLADYIIQTQHMYVSKKLPEIKLFLDKVMNKHGERHSELKKVHQFFSLLVKDLTGHMQKEEQILFPYIKELAISKKEQHELPAPGFGSVVNPINAMEQEHERAGDIFKEIRNLTNNLTPPADACKTYRIVFAMLDEFETNLHLHIHLENNILFPKAIKLEKEVVL